MDREMRGILVLLMVFHLCYCNNLEVHPPDIIKQGDTVRLICTIANPTEDSVNNISKVIDSTHHVIASNNELQPPFDTIDRYSTGNSTDPTARSEVVIEDVQGADSGTIACNSEQNDPMTAIEAIHVKIPPTVELRYSGNAVEDGETVDVTNNDMADYACVVAVDGDLTPPAVSIILGDQDITASMEFNDAPVVASQNGLLENKYSGTYSKGETSPELAQVVYDGKALTCTAEVVPFDKVSMSFSIKYSPGCADIPEKAGRIVERTDDGDGSSLTIRCNNTQETSYLVCENSEWIGEIGNCSDVDVLTPVEEPLIVTDSILDDEVTLVLEPSVASNMSSGEDDSVDTSSAASLSISIKITLFLLIVIIK